jgi:hypothetical protein
MLKTAPGTVTAFERRRVNPGLTTTTPAQRRAFIARVMRFETCDAVADAENTSKGVTSVDNE